MCEQSPEEIAGRSVQVPDSVGDTLDWENSFGMVAMRVSMDPVDRDKRWVGNLHGSEGMVGYVIDETNEFTPIATFDSPFVPKMIISDLVALDDYLLVACSPNIYAESYVFALDRSGNTFRNYETSDSEARFQGDVIHMCRADNSGNEVYWIRMEVTHASRLTARNNGNFYFNLCHYDVETNNETILATHVVDDPGGGGEYGPFNLTVGSDGMVWVMQTTGKYFMFNFSDEGLLPTASGGPPAYKTILRYDTSGTFQDSFVMADEEDLGVDLTVCGDSVHVLTTFYEGGS